MSRGEPFTLKHFRGWSKRLVLDNGESWVLEPFQELFLDDVFGGTPTCWLVVPEGNGKTTLVAGLLLYHLEHTEEGRVPVAASSRQQAEILYAQAEGFCLRSPHLAVAETFKCQEGYRRIRCDAMRSRAQIFAADDATADGIIPTMAIVEELHRHKNLKLYDTWRGKHGKRQGQTIVISTAGEPGGEFEERRKQIRAKSAVTRDGSFVRSAQDAVVMHEWSLQDGEDPEDLEAVARCNPFTGITVESLRGKFQSADFSLPHWRRFTCNLPTRSEHSAITESEWFAAATDQRIPEGEPVDVGLDLGWKWDTTAIVPEWTRDEEYRLFGPAVVLVPPRDGNFMDPQRVKDALERVNGRNPIRMLVMDMSDARDIAEWAESELGCTIVQRGQQIPQKVDNYKHFTRELRGRRLWHSGDEDMTAHVLNAAARLLPGGDSCFSRPVDNRSRDTAMQDRRVIDALDAASMVHAVVMANPVSMYQDGEMVAA